MHWFLYLACCLWISEPIARAKASLLPLSATGKGFKPESIDAKNVAVGPGECGSRDSGRSGLYNEVLIILR